MNSVKYDVPNISCGHCVEKIENGLKQIDGVYGVWADSQSRSVEVEFGPPAEEEIIKEHLEKINYPVAQ
jgi:copper chaperone CopZ